MFFKGLNDLNERKKFKLAESILFRAKQASLNRMFGQELFGQIRIIQRTVTTLPVENDRFAHSGTFRNGRVDSNHGFKK